MIDIMTGWWMASVAWLVAMAFMAHLIYAFNRGDDTPPLSFYYAIIISVFAGIIFVCGLLVALFAKPLF